MDWNVWNGKRVFVRTKSGKVFSGGVVEVVDVGDGLIFISLKDKFGKWVTLASIEIVEIKED